MSANAADRMPVLMSDRKNRILYANEAYRQECGLTPEELKNVVTPDLLHPDNPAQVLQDMRATLAQRMPWSGIIRVRHKDLAQGRWLRLSIMPLWADGRYAGGLLVHSEAEPAELARTVALYGQMRAGRSGLGVQHGRVVRTGLASRLARAGRALGLHGRIWLGIACVDLAAVAGLWPALRSDPAGAAAALGLLALASVAAGVFLSRSIVRPLREVLAFAHQAAGCDLAGEMHSSRSDEIGQLARALSQLTVNMRATVSDVRDLARRMQRETGDIAEGAQQLSQHTEAQAGSLEETAASMEEMTASVQQSTSALRDAADAARWSRRLRRRCRASPSPAAASPRSTGSSTASRSRPTSWR